jgi:hypothetical protein
MSENTPEEVIENIEPPEVILTATQLSETSEVSEILEITETDKI